MTGYSSIDGIARGTGASDQTGHHLKAKAYCRILGALEQHDGGACHAKDA